MGHHSQWNQRHFYASLPYDFNFLHLMKKLDRKADDQSIS